MPNRRKHKVCKLFKSLSLRTWKKINRIHAVGLEPREIGITTDLITEILHFEKKHKIGFGVFAQEGKDEINYGSDMDVFVEVLPNKYKWYALQAKVLKSNKKYDFRVDKGKKPQWERLDDMGKMTGCTAYYLLYNGMRGRRYRGLKDSCDVHFPISQFGCSLVAPSTVAREVAIKKSIHFDVFHPHEANPWKILTCCHKPIAGNHMLYKLDDIKAAKRNYEELSKTGILEIETKSIGLGELAREAEEFRWYPDYTMIISQYNK